MIFSSYILCLFFVGRLRKDSENLSAELVQKKLL